MWVGLFVLLVVGVIYFERVHRLKVSKAEHCPVAQVVVAFGYKDARPARFVGDRYEAMFVLERLKELGFVRAAADDELWVKASTPWTRGIQLRLVQSSAGPDDEANRLNPWQKIKSAEAQRAFVAGLREAEHVLYVGHSRVGGGPDFEPPLLRPDKHVDYDVYKRATPGLKMIGQALRSQPVKLISFGLYSCSSGPHFESALRHWVPTVKLETTAEPLYYVDSLNSVTSRIREIVSAPCR